MKKQKSGKKWLFVLAWILGSIAILPPLLFPSARPMPPGTDIVGSAVPTRPEDIRLLIDDTAWDPDGGRRVIRQEIFDELLAMIGRADRLIYLDMFLWNPWKGSVPEEHRRLSTELAQALISRKAQVPDLEIIALTDPINRIYGDTMPGFFDDLSRAGILVVFTELSLLPESNRIFSPYWSLAEMILKAPPFREWSAAPRLGNPFQADGPDVSLLQFGRMLRFKANHRKVAVTGSVKHGLEMLLGSFNPADGSSAHSNTALHVRGSCAREVLASELEVLRWSLGPPGKNAPLKSNPLESSVDSMRKRAEALTADKKGRPEWPKVRLLTEGAIGRTLVSLFDSASTGDEVRAAMFYLSERNVVEAVKRAAQRGVTIRLILDSNRDAFGMKKIGIPNRPVAAELMDLSTDHNIRVRWADTHGEQFHNKAFSLSYGHSGSGVFLAGSANWTRRNIGNLNLEANLLLDGAPHVMETFNSYFDTLWDNSDGLSHTVPYGRWREKGIKLAVKDRLYRFQERFGAGTF